ncbi:MAG: Xylulose kinase [Elusimicrobia bacterium ADurb.Bin231]|nr:MAG: Xylulose kinase [Elusimicrobia bacterium ADurb.Bin231]
MYFLGYDVGSSSIKVSILEGQSGKIAASATSPKKELEIFAAKSGWAEQKPDTWWQNAKAATAEVLSKSQVDPSDIKAIGISYQMHGLVLVDKNMQVLRDAIIWCDSRAVPIGEKAAKEIGGEKCLKTLLNLPGNFTATRLKWIKDNEPDTYRKIYKAILPGEYIAMKMTDKICTTPSGLSEHIMWDSSKDGLSEMMLKYFGFEKDFYSEVVPSFSEQGQLTAKAASELGLKAGTKVTYRGGDQPNNALSLNVLNPGEIAATAGTSGVVYGITDKPVYDSKSRVNTFVHINYSKEKPRYGILLCVSGTGILNSWLRSNVMDNMDYRSMNELAAKAPIGSEGLSIMPFGNGAERTLENKDIGAQICGLRFNTHKKQHVLRAGQEGIVFALNFGLQIMNSIGVKVSKVRACDANMFLSPLFGQAFACVTNAVVELYNTDGSAGAARGAGVGLGFYKDFSEAFAGLKSTRTIEPNEKICPQYKAAYDNWLEAMKKITG